MRRWASIPCVSLGLLVGIFTAGCGSYSSSSSSNPIVVSITSPTSPPSIQQGQTVNITASVSYDSSNQGVSWSVSGQGCVNPACGTLSNQTSTSVTYNAPALVSANLTVMVMATSVANHLQSASITITVTPPPTVSVTITDKITTINAGGNAVTLNATVQNDPSNKGVTWTLAAPNGTACTPGCGALSSAQAFSVTYTPPSSVVSTLNPIVKAVSVADATKFDSNEFLIFSASEACGSGNESVLKGEYGVLLQGWTGSGIGTPVAIAASFAADGGGGITGGSEDVNDFNGALPTASILASGSSYSVGSDERGCLTLALQGGGTTTFRFALGSISAGVASKGAIIEFDDTTVNGQRASGILRLQDPVSFSLATLSANYAFALDGWDNRSAHVAIAGSFAQSQGDISKGVFDTNDGGIPFPTSSGITGTIQPISTVTGRTTATLSANGFGPTLGIYVVDSSEIFIFGTNSGAAGNVFSGRAIATASSFTSSSVSPQYIFRSTGNFEFTPVVSIGLANLSGGSVSATIFEDDDGSASTQNFSGNYTVDGSSGRTVISSGGVTSLILYLTNSSDGVSAFSIGLDAAASIGVFDTQPAATYSTNSLSGSFYLGSNMPGDITVSNLSGTGTISSGAVNAIEDVAPFTGLSPAVAFSGMLSISANGSGNLGGTAVSTNVAVTNGTVLFFIDESDMAPLVQVFEP